MKRILRWMGVGLGVLVVLAGLAVSVAYLATEPLIRRTYDDRLQSIVVPTDATSIAEGKRLALIRGCFDGCHGKGASGGVFVSEPWVVQIIAPDLTRVAADHSDAELERVIRRGVRKDGSSTWVMPSTMFFHLSGEDLGRIIAFIRSLPLSSGPDTDVQFGPAGRLLLVIDPISPQAEEIERDAPWLTPLENRGAHGFGRYLALTACTECHGMNLRGTPDGAVPNLVVAAAYSEAQFAHLMKTGDAIGERKLDLMALVAQERFSHFTEEEVQALYDYLQARARELP